MSIISLPEAGIRYECDSNNFRIMHIYNKSIGKLSPWMIIENGKQYIDTIAYERQSTILNGCWKLNTEYLYWLMLEIFETETKIARYLAGKSDIFKSVPSWTGFLYVGMFSPNIVYKVDLRPTQQTEFTKLSVRAIAIALKNGIKIGKDFE